MWYIKKEYMEEVNSSNDFNDCLKTIRRLVEEGKGFSVPFTYGKSNIALQHHYIKSIKEDYEFIYFDIG